MLLTLLQSQGISPALPKIYQEIWIIEEKKPKKRVKRAERRIRRTIKEIDAQLEAAHQKACQGNLEAKQLQNLNDILIQHLDLVSLEYGKLEAEVKLNRAQVELERQLQLAIEQKLNQIAKAKNVYEDEAEQQRILENDKRRWREIEETAQLEFLLEYLMHEYD